MNEPRNQGDLKSAPQQSRSADEIQDWIVQQLCDNLQMTPDQIDIGAPLESYAMDSAMAIGLTGDLEDWLGKRVEPTVFYDYPTIEEVSEHLAETG